LYGGPIPLYSSLFTELVEKVNNYNRFLKKQQKLEYKSLTEYYKLIQNLCTDGSISRCQVSPPSVPRNLSDWNNRRFALRLMLPVIMFICHLMSIRQWHFFIIALCASPMPGRLEANVTSSTKPEVQNESQHHRRSIERRPQATCTENLVKYGCLTFEICSRTDRYIDRYTDSCRSQYFGGEVIISGQWEYWNVSVQKNAKRPPELTFSPKLPRKFGLSSAKWVVPYVAFY